MKTWGVWFLAVLLTILSSSSQAEVEELVRLRVKVALLSALESPKVQGRVKGVKSSLICEVVDWCFDAAILTPSFGDEKEAGIKLICAAYGESGFHPEARGVNAHKKDRRYRYDCGIMQVNSIHWITPAQEPTWRQFCNMMGYDYDLRQIWNPKINIEFAAVINEMLIQAKLKPYRFAHPGRPDQCYIYKQLQKAIK